MSRSEGFPIADIDVGILDDPKVRALVRSTRDEAVVARAIVGYLAVVTSSWGRGERVTLEDAVPLWVTTTADISERLVAVGLLDEDTRVPERAWKSWFGPAWDRREERRESGRKGGLAKHRNESLAQLDHSQSDGTTELYPSVPSVRSIPTGSVPSVDEPERSLNGKDHDGKTCPGCGDIVNDWDPNVVVVDRRGSLGHRKCPDTEIKVRDIVALMVADPSEPPRSAP